MKSDQRASFSPAVEQRRLQPLRRLTTKIAGGIVVSTAIGLVSLFVFVYPSARKHLTEVEIERVHGDAHHLATEMNRELEAGLHELEAAAALDAMTATDARELDPLVAGLESASQFFRHLTVLSPDGLIRARPSIANHVGQRRDDRPYVDFVRDHARTFVGEPRISSHGNLSLNVGTPIFDGDGVLVGILMGSLGLADRNPGAYRPVLEPNLPDGWTASLYTAQGQLLASSGRAIDRAEGLGGLDVTGTALWDAVLGVARNGALEFDAPNESRWVGVAPLQLADWVLVVDVADGALMAPVIDLTRRLLYWASAASLMVLLSGAWLATSLSRRTTRLTQALNRYAATGAVETVSLPGHDELTEAAEAFNQMVTERERVEAELVAREAELQQAIKMEALGRLAGGVAHDFNNLLTVMAVSSDEVLHDIDPDHPHADAMRQIRDATDRAASVSRRLLGFSRQSSPERTRLDLNEVVRGMGQLFRPLIGGDVTLDVCLPMNPTWIDADQSHLEQVLMNLVVNARDAMPNGGSLTVRVLARRLTLQQAAKLDVEPGPHAVLEVLDTGTGMSESVRRRVFDPFYTTKAPGHGTGLGLSMVHGLVTQHGGRIWVESEEGCGACFFVCFRRMPEPDAEDSTFRTSTGLRPVNQTGNVLVVEDQDIVRTVAIKTLRKAGYEVSWARNAEDAVTLFEQAGGQIDVVVTDIVMPGTNGVELADALQIRDPGLAVVLVSGHPGNHLARFGSKGTAYPFLAKPYGSQELLNRVSEALQARIAG